MSRDDELVLMSEELEGLVDPEQLVGDGPTAVSFEITVPGKADEKDLTIVGVAVDVKLREKVMTILGAGVTAEMCLQAFRKLQVGRARSDTRYSKLTLKVNEVQVEYEKAIIVGLETTTLPDAGPRVIKLTCQV